MSPPRVFVCSSRTQHLPEGRTYPTKPYAYNIVTPPANLKPRQEIFSPPAPAAQNSYYISFRPPTEKSCLTVKKFSSPLLPHQKRTAPTHSPSDTPAQSRLRYFGKSTQEREIPLSLAMVRTLSTVISLSSAISARTSALMGS